MKRIWYYIVKIYISIGLFFFYKKIIVVDEGNIPKKGAVLLVSNHKNALIDPLIIATSLKRNIHFLTRASAFKIKFVKWLLSTVNMLPIYRMRDGKETLAKNEAVFNECYTILNNKRCLLIFPEGTHDIRRLVRPLSKGFTRIAFGVFEKYPELELHIVPVGLNYTDATLFGESASVYYGKPILANTFFNKEDINGSTVSLKNAVSEKMKELTTHIEIDSYDAIINQLGDVDFLNPIEVNQLIGKMTNEKFQITSHRSQNLSKSKKTSFLWKLLKIIVAINSIVPLLIYKVIEPNIEEIEFVSTTKFSIGVTAFPLFYLLQSVAVYDFFGSFVAIIYLLISILSVIILAKTK